MWHPLLCPLCVATAILCLQWAASSHANGTRPAGRAPAACPGLPLREDKMGTGPAPPHAHAASLALSAQRRGAELLPAQRGGQQSTSSPAGFGDVAAGSGEREGAPTVVRMKLQRKTLRAERELIIPRAESPFWGDLVWSFSPHACGCLARHPALLCCALILPLCLATVTLGTTTAALQLLARRLKSSQRGRDSERQSKEQWPGSSLGRVRRAAAPECAICLQPYEAHELLKLLPCSHAYHRSCIDRWHRAQRGARTCPLCLRAVTAVALVPLGAGGCRQE